MGVRGAGEAEEGDVEDPSDDAVSDKRVRLAGDSSPKEPKNDEIGTSRDMATACNSVTRERCSSN